MMRLRRLIHRIENLEVKGPKDVEITGICANSKRVAPGNLFVAKRGLIHDGTRFIKDAIASGASCVLSDLFDPFLKITQLIHLDVASIEAKLAAEFFHQPSQEIKVIGITGTNGKTTSGFLIKHLLDQSGQSASMIGTVDWIVGDHYFPAEMTTPGPIKCQKLLREMVSASSCFAIMEVSSHALDQKRVDEIDFDIALFTNMTQDHLDYHGNFEEYAKAKKSLFSRLSEKKWAILNADDPYTKEFQKATRAQIFTYGIETDADLMAKDLRISDTKIEFFACIKEERIFCRSELIGRFNVYNLLGTLSVGLCSKLPLQTSVALLQNFKQVPGRLERVKNRLGLHIFVDFAHTEDALCNVLLTLGSIKKGKLITVFGCGGDRDRGKRSKMGAVVCELADEAIITSDNSRSEDPKLIANQVLKGFFQKQNVIIEIDRKRAIQIAIEQAKKNDIILIAGKGHEKEQIIDGLVFPFDDAKIAYKLCQERELNLR